MKSKSIVVAAGTRPEVIKLAPVIEKLREEGWQVEVVNTSQQSELSKSYFNEFNIKIDYEFDLTLSSFSLSDFFGEILDKFSHYLKNKSDFIVLVQGDTTTVLACSLAAFYSGNRVIHLEAGLRSGDKFSPFPEEVNRRVTSQLADLHLAPTIGGVQNLILENIEFGSVVEVGNTVIDTLLRQIIINSKTEIQNQILSDHCQNFPRNVFVTMHRRENLDANIYKVIDFINLYSKDHSDIGFIFQVHSNPKIINLVNEHLRISSNILRVQPIPYCELVHVLSNCSVVMTDSGGLQEEALAIGAPLLVLRTETERPEILSSEYVRIVNSNFSDIKEKLEELLGQTRSTMLPRVNIVNTTFGDGNASNLVVKALNSFIESTK
jgi:UDP-N-acetylglucosamine 2-epimerase (non-hydrolysing)